METKLTFTHVIPTAIIEAFGITDDTPVYAYILDGTIYVEPVLDEDDGLTEDDCPYPDEDDCGDCDDCAYYSSKQRKFKSN